MRVAGMRKTFPDVHFSVDDIFADGSGDKVTFRWTSRGTDQGGIMGRPATGKLVVVTGINIVVVLYLVYRLREGRSSQKPAPAEELKNDAAASRRSVG